MYLERTLETPIHALNSSLPVRLLTGPLQVGKTTLQQKLGAA